MDRHAPFFIVVLDVEWIVDGTPGATNFHVRCKKAGSNGLVEKVDNHPKSFRASCGQPR